VSLLNSNIDYFGFNFIEESPRYVEQKWAIEMYHKYNLGEKFVALFRSDRADILNNIITYSPESTLQIYGDLKTDHFLHKLLIPVSVTTLKQNAYKDLLNSNKHKYLVDNMINNLGGTGKKVDLNSIDKNLFPTIMIAGGIGIDDINNLQNLNFWGVDINSKIELSPGIKDQDMIKILGDFIEK